MSLLNFDPLALAVLGVAGVLVALAELLLGQVRRLGATRLSLILAGVLALAGAAGAAADLPGWVWQPTLLLAGLQGILALARAPRLWKFFGRPALQAGVLLVCGGALLGWQVYRLEAGLETEMALTELELTEFTEPPELSGPPAYVAKTDGDRPVPLFRLSPDYPVVSREGEARFLRGIQLDHKVIQTARPDLTTNCHGWVFTGGRYWVRGNVVESILQDNGYEATTTPRPDDLVVFRNALGEVTHTGIVRGNAGDNLLIESKWGQMGRYIHTAEDHGYRGQQATYYRTSRGGHLLQGLDYPKPPMNLISH